MINQINSPTRKQVSALSHVSVASGKTKISNEMKIQNISNFDQAKIIEHYRTMRQLQHQKLATLNMNQQMKRKLFGFSQGYYLTNNVDPKNLVVQDHPLRGKIIQTKEKYAHYLIQKQKEKEIRSGIMQVNSISKIHTENKAEFSSDLQLNINNFFNEPPTESIYLSEAKDGGRRKGK